MIPRTRSLPSLGDWPAWTRWTASRTVEANPAQIRRSLARAERGAALDVTEATALLGARGEQLDRLCVAAARVRDAGLRAAGRPGVVTYSPKVFIPVTRLCRDRCHYCTFVTTPGHLARAAGRRVRRTSPPTRSSTSLAGAPTWAASRRCSPSATGRRTAGREARAWLDEQGYDSTLAYVRAMAIRVLEETGLLPHLNPGVMSWEEMNRLKPVAPSMGMMLETTSRRLFEEKGEAHYGSPDKDPAVRLRVLDDAGRLSVPFTTGLLVGIGETLTERAETIFAIRASARRFGAVQEVIVQNFRAKPETAMRHADDLGSRRVPRRHRGHPARARPEDAGAGAAQPGRPAPSAGPCSDAGVDDWGGVSPLTPDHVNPERPWPSLERLRAITAECGFELRPRLTVHPEYVVAGEPWLDPRVSGHVAALARPTTVSRAPAYVPRACRGRSRTAARAPPRSGRRPHRPAHRRRHRSGRTDDRRSDFDAVYGDWDALREDSPARKAPSRAEIRCRSCGLSALAAAERDPAGLTDEQALTLMTAEGELLEQVCRLADDLRRDTVGDDVTYVVNRNINFTNVCYVGCRFCAFAQRRTDADAFSLSLEQVADRAQEAWELGATEVCMQGGIDPELPGSAYFDLARRREAPRPRHARARLLADGDRQRRRRAPG